MAKYTFLVVARQRNATSASLGKISAFQKEDGVWGSKEILPNFDKIIFDGTREEVNFVYRVCSYDFSKQSFIHKDSGDLFNADTDVITNITDYSGGNERDKQLAKQLTGINTISPCSVLRAGHRGEFGNDERSYWIRLYYPFRKLSGVKVLVEAAKYGVYADCRKAFLALDKTTQQVIFDNSSDDDKEYFRWLYSVDFS